MNRERDEIRESKSKIEYAFGIWGVSPQRKTEVTERLSSPPWLFSFLFLFSVFSAFLCGSVLLGFLPNPGWHA